MKGFLDVYGHNAGSFTLVTFVSVTFSYSDIDCRNSNVTALALAALGSAT
jgi:hypothetical protein